MKEVEAVVNSRPLVYVGADFSSGFVITPKDFLSLNPKPGGPSLAEEDRLQKHLKAPRTQSSSQPTKGDVVLLKESSPRGTWRLAVVEELISSTDGEIRAATVQTASGKLLNRTLNFLYPLECAEQRETPVQSSRSEDGQYDASHQRTGQKLPTERPIRKAAIKARQALNKLLNI